MAGIININNNYDMNTKRVSSKLSFQVGEVFLARVMNVEELTGDMLLKLLDGWQFSAKLENPLNFTPEGLMKFQVEGFEDGKLQLAIVNTNKKEEKTEKKSIENLLQEQNLNVDKDDIKLLEKMVRRNIPLTKENISNVKTILDLGNKVKYEENFIENFTEKYIANKNIDLASPKANEIRATLRGFFESTKVMNESDVLTFIENNLDFNEGNIKSYSKLFKASNVLYNDIMEINKTMENELNKLNNIKLPDTLQKHTINPEFALDGFEASINEKGIINVLGEKLEQVLIPEKLLEKAIETINNGGNIETDKEEILNKEQNANKGQIIDKLIKGEDKNLKDGLKPNDQIKAKDIQETSVKDPIVKEATVKDIEVKGKDIHKIINNMDLDNSSKLVKEAISNKTEEVKSVIKAIFDSKTELKGDSYNKVMQVLEQKINDIKVFNSVSNQYYYMDLPVKAENSDYQCKLLIKDDRKKGKKIDSANVKIAASVNTNHMGTVDAYIKVSNKIMDVDIKCEENWIKLIMVGKSKVQEELEKLGYNVHVSVEEKINEMTLPSCREFFGDNSFGTIDRRV